MPPPPAETPMKLLDDIIAMAADDKEPIGSLLRKCLILESQIRNEKFRAWLNLELDGYDRDREDEFPDYRVFNCVSKGDFLGETVQLNSQPISLHIMDEHDFKLLKVVRLHQPAASYEGRPDRDRDARLPWNPYLTAKYQSKIYQNGDPVLLQAWQEIPGSVLVALLEQVRTRVLRFALALKESAGEQSVSTLPRESIGKSVDQHILKKRWT